MLFRNGDVVGKIARRVCLVRYPDPKELAKPRGLTTFALSNQNPKGTGMVLYKIIESVIKNN